MNETNPNYEQNSQIEAARLTVDAVFAEIGLELPRDENNKELIQPQPAMLARPVLIAEVLTQTGITEMQSTDNHLDFARAMVSEAHRDVPEINPILSGVDDTNEQFKLAA